MFFGYFFLILSHSRGLPMIRITGLFHIFKWKNLQNWWLNKILFCPTVYLGRLYLVCKPKVKKNATFFDLFSIFVLLHWAHPTSIVRGMTKGMIISRVLTSFYFMCKVLESRVKGIPSLRTKVQFVYHLYDSNMVDAASNVS